MKTMLRPAVMVFFLLTVITGFIYPALITAVGKIFFPYQAHGSLIKKADQIIGSELIGQSFTHPKYFWGRPSATATSPYNPLASGGSNLGPLNPLLVTAVTERITLLRAADPSNTLPIPIELVTTSASGLDPHISPAAAHYQINRVAKARMLSVEQVTELVQQHVEKRQFYLLGEPRINVLRLNLALEGIPQND